MHSAVHLATHPYTHPHIRVRFTFIRVNEWIHENKKILQGNKIKWANNEYGDEEKVWIKREQKRKKIIKRHRRYSGECINCTTNERTTDRTNGWGCDEMRWDAQTYNIQVKCELIRGDVKCANMWWVRSSFFFSQASQSPHYTVAQTCAYKDGLHGYLHHQRWWQGSYINQSTLCERTTTCVYAVRTNEQRAKVRQR